MSQPWWSDPSATGSAPRQQPGGAEQPPAAPWMPPPTQSVPQSPWMPPATGPTGQQAPQHHAGGPTQPLARPAQPIPPGDPVGVPFTGRGSTSQLATAGPTAQHGQQPAAAPTVPGLGFAVFLLVVGTLVFAGTILREWVVDWATAVDPCLDAGGSWECVSNDGSRLQVLYPVVAIFAAFSLARGASVERVQGRAIGWLYALLGAAAIAVAWSVGAGA